MPVMMGMIIEEEEGDDHIPPEILDIMRLTEAMMAGPSIFGNNVRPVA